MKRIFIFMKLQMSVLIVFIGFGQTAAQITGKITENDIPTVETEVRTKDQNARAFTDEEGKFEIDAKEGDTLIVSLYGEEKEVIAKPNMLVNFSIDLIELNEGGTIIAIAYGERKKEELTGAVGVVPKDRIKNNSIPNVLKSLDGAIAGLQVSGTGMPGDDNNQFGVNNVIIRGINSIKAFQGPLIVVDGIVYNGSLSSINSADIEEISVLKDASSTALYGSRAAGGVILITTKKVQKGKVSVELTARTGVNSRMMKDYKKMKNPKDYYETFWNALYLSEYDAGDPSTDEAARKYASENIIDYLGYNCYDVPDNELINPTTGKLNPDAKLLYQDDWDKALIKTRSFNDLYLNVSGGSETSRTMLSLGYQKNNGIVYRTDYQRISAKLKQEYDIKDWLKLGANLGYTNGKQNLISYDFNNPISWSRLIPSIYPIYKRDDNGNYIYDNKGNKEYDYGDGNERWRNFNYYYNPLSRLDNGIQEIITDQFNGALTADFKFLNDFNLKINIAEELHNSTETRYISIEDGEVNASNQTRFRKEILTLQQLLGWKKKIDKNSFDILIGHETSEMKHKYLSSEVENFIIDNPNQNMGIGSPFVDNYTDNYKVQGYFGKLDYNFDSRYYLSASYRRDASSVFHPDERWGNFWALAGAWRISNEDFMNNIKFVNELKLSFGYGTQGNDDLLYEDIDNYNRVKRNYSAYKDKYRVENVAGEPGLKLEYLGNKNLKWEKTEGYNIGLFFELFKGRITGQFDWYRKNTKDLLYNKRLSITDPEYLGANYMPTNLGNMYNQGIELALGLGIIDNKDFKFRLNLNTTYNQNKITKIAEINMDGYLFEKGKSYGTHYLREFAGVNHENGHSLYYKNILDIEENPTGERATTENSAEADKYDTGKSTMPKWYGGFGFDLNYKNFDLNIGFAYQLGGWALDLDYMYLMDNYGYGSNYHNDAFNAWTPNNPNSNIPSLELYYKDNSAVSTRYLIKTDYLALRNITMGYTFSIDDIKFLGLESVRVFLSVQNVFLISKRRGYDPSLHLNGDSGSHFAGENIYSDYPTMRTISGGFTLKF